MQSLVQFYADHHIEKVYVKSLAANDNSKNQVYFGPGFEALTLFPVGEIYSDPSERNPIFKGSTKFFWIDDDLSVIPAPCAKIILYPQYPEIRFSGFLKNINRNKINSIRELMNSRTPERLLFLGVGKSGNIIGSVFGPDTPVAQELRETVTGLTKVTEIFFELLTAVFLGTGNDPKIILLKELCRIHRLGWIGSKRLDGIANTLPCNAPQCGGYTLEAELGITPNGRSEPDFHGWEVKQHGGSVLTLMTPEPTGGFYFDHGVEDFVRTFGYMDKKGIPDRMNFGGTHYCNTKHASTGLTLSLHDYDSTTGKIIGVNGGVALTSDNGTVAAFWKFSGILEHWNRKHRNAVYVASKHRTNPENQYSYGKTVKLGQGTDPLFFLKAMAEKAVYYDPGIKLENMNSDRPKTKSRSQFRVKLRQLTGLYDKLTNEDVTAYC